jgi:hypothetical protein
MAEALASHASPTHAPVNSAWGRDMVLNVDTTASLKSASVRFVVLALGADEVGGENEWQHKENLLKNRKEDLIAPVSELYDGVRSNSLFHLTERSETIYFLGLGVERDKDDKETPCAFFSLDAALSRVEALHDHMLCSQLSHMGVAERLPATTVSDYSQVKLMLPITR